jgi:hypothetical protein
MTIRSCRSENRCDGEGDSSFNPKVGNVSIDEGLEVVEHAVDLSPRRRYPATIGRCSADDAGRARRVS